MRRIILQITLCLAVLWALLLGALCSPRTALVLQPWLADRLTTVTGSPVTIGRLQVTPWPLTLAAWEVHYGQNDGPVWLQAAHISVQPNLWRSIMRAGRPVLRRLEFAGLTVRATLQDPPAARNDGAANSMAASSLGPLRGPLPADIEHIVLKDGDIAFRQGALAYEAAGVNMSLGPYSFGHRPWLVEATMGRLHHPALATARESLDVVLRGDLLGALFWPKTVHLERLSARLGDVPLTVQGDVDISGQAPEHGAELQVITALGPLGALWPPVASLEGELRLGVTLLRPFDGPEAAFTGSIQHLARAHMPALGDVHFTGAITQQQLRLARLTLQADATHALMARGTLQLATPQDFELALTSSNLDMEPLIQAALGRPSPWGGRLSGTMAGTGTLAKQWSLRSSWNLSGSNIRLAGKNSGQGPWDILAIPTLGLEAETVVRAERTEVCYARVAVGQSHITVDGQVAHSKHGPTVQARLSARDFDLTELGPIAKTRYLGIASVDGTLTGPLLRPKVQGHAEVSSFVVGPLKLGACESTLRFDAPILSLTDLVVRQAGGTLSGALSLHFVPPALQLRATLEANHVDIGRLSALIGLPPAAANQLAGGLFGPVRLAGPLLRPSGTAVLATPNLLLAGAPFGPATLAVRFGESNRRVALAVRAEPHGGTLAGQLTWHDDGSLMMDTTGRALPVALWPNIAAAQITGLASLQLNAEGPLKNLIGGATLNIDDVVVSGQGQGGVHAMAHLRDKTLRGSLSLLRGGLHGEGCWQLDQDMRGQAHGGLDALNLAAFLPLAVPHPSASLDTLSSIITGTWRISGAFAKPQGLQAEANIQALQLGLRGADMKLRRPAAITLRDGLARVSPMLLQGPLMTVDMAGTVPLASDDHRLGATLKAHGDLAALATLSNFIDAGHGPFTAQMSLQESLRAPRIMGEATVNHGSLRMNGQDRPLEHIEARLVFTGRTAAITQARATLGDGRLTLAGEANVGAGTWQDPQGLLSLRLHLHRVPMRPTADVDLIASGNLELTGGLSDNALRGDITLDGLRYTARIDLDKLVPKRAAPPLKAPMMPAGRATRLAVHVKAPGNLLISSAVLEAELGADLTLTGTTDRVGLIGSVTPLWARAKWHDNLFVLTRSSIDFVDEYRIAPQFNVVARTHACQMDADVQIQGSVDGFNVTPTGRDERGPVNPQDVLTCLQFGLRLRDFDGNQKSGATAGALSSGLDALWTVSGLDAKVRRFLPIAVDELRLTSGWSSNAQRTTPRVLVAKDLGHHLSLRYQRSIDEFNDQAFSLDYKIAQHTALSAGWLTARDVDIGDFGVDLRLHWSLR